MVCGPDDETIVFWSKYYGVFQSTVPSAQYAWAAGNMIEDVPLSITYQYSFREDLDPISLLEMNRNSHITANNPYVPIFDKNLFHHGENWVGSPFIEIDTSNGGYKFKLRFKPQ